MGRRTNYRGPLYAQRDASLALSRRAYTTMEYLDPRCCAPPPTRHFPLSYDLCSLVAVSTGYWLKYTHSRARPCIQIYAHTGVCDIVVPCKSPPSLSPILPILAQSVDRVNRVKSARHASRSNRLTRGDSYTGYPRDRNPSGCNGEAHRRSLASFLPRTERIPENTWS